MERGDILRRWTLAALLVAIFACFIYVGGSVFVNKGTPSRYISEREAIRIAKDRDASGVWRAQFVSNADVTVDGKQSSRPLWVLYSAQPGQPANLRLYLDAVTGAPLQETFINIVR